MQTFTIELVSVVAIVSLCCSCGKKELDRRTAMRLIQGTQAATPVVINFLAADWGGELRPAYQELENAGIIKCHPEGPFRMCVSSNASLIRVVTGGENRLQLSAGTVAPAAVTGVAQMGPDSATADVQFSFQAAPLYAQHQAAFNRLYDASRSSYLPISERTQPEARRAVFQRYDDGWRFQGFQ